MELNESTLQPKKMQTSFCLPQEHIPTSEWVNRLLEGKSLLLKIGGGMATNQSWIYQTWALLITTGTRCYTFTQLPEKGIVITLNAALPDPCKTPDNVFLVDVVADGVPHPAAHLHIVQNKAHAERLPRSVFMPHWPQPGLVPRDPKRGTRFETVSFFGYIGNLAPELRSASWRRRLEKELGLELHLPEVHEWYDYSHTDCVLAVRDFSKSRYLQKPATKLYDAWHAGVPFIGGRDSAYASNGHPEKDYLVATSAEEVFQHLKRLKEDKTFRETLVQNGSQSGSHFSQEATLKRWKQLVEETLPKLASEWQKKTPFARWRFLMTQHLFCFLDRYLK